MMRGRKAISKGSKEEKIVVQESSGNVFADLQLPDAAELLAKAEIAERICSIIQSRKLTQSEAAKLLRIDQPKISSLMRGKLEGFSSDRLFKFLNALGRDVEIVIRRHPGTRNGVIRVTGERRKLAG